MDEAKKLGIRLDPDGFNELRMCRSGPMLYNKHDIFVGGSLKHYGEFSIGELEVFSQIVRPGGLVIEVGANIGAHTVELSRLAGPGGTVHAFEPQRIVFQTMCANLSLNQCTNVYARQAAVGAATGTIAVPALDPSIRFNFGGLSLQGTASGEHVPLMTLDSFDFPACQLLKVDVEGMEVDVLKGGVHLVTTHRPIMYLENDRVERSAELLTMVDSLDYTAYWHFPAVFNPDNYYSNSENIFGSFGSFNILCIPKEINFDVVGLRKVSSPYEEWSDLV